MNINAPSSNFYNLPWTKRQDPDESKKNQKRLPLIGRVPNKIRNHFVAMLGEFCGTFLFLFFAFSGTQIANAAAAAETSASSGGNSLPQAPNASVLQYISLVFGFSLAVNAWVFFRISGGLFNPAVALALALIGAITWIRMALVIFAELLASICVSFVVSALFPGDMAVSTTLATGTSITRGLFIEMFLTFELVFTICMLAAEKHKGTFLAPIGIGLALFVAELGGVYFTGGSLNPARSFGPCVALGSFPGYHWIYWLGPALGAILAVGLYRIVKLLEYETANPGADFNEKEDAEFEFDEENAASAADVARPIPSPHGVGQLKKSKTTPEEDLNPNADSDGRHYRTNDPRTELHPGFGGGDAAYRNSSQAEEGNMRDSYRAQADGGQSRQQYLPRVEQAGQENWRDYYNSR